MRTLLGIAISLFLAGAGSMSHATEPMIDRLTVGERTGVVFPSECCWMALPASERLRAAKIAESCTAIGGPVGRFLYEGGKLWLTGLQRCDGPMRVREIYPDFDERVLADWLTGTFRGKLDWLCSTNDHGYVYRTELIFTIERGVVVTVVEKNFDKSSC